jgi:hypothetical protein
MHKSVSSATPVVQTPPPPSPSPVPEKVAKKFLCSRWLVCHIFVLNDHFNCFSSNFSSGSKSKFLLNEKTCFSVSKLNAGCFKEEKTNIFGWKRSMKSCDESFWWKLWMKTIEGNLRWKLSRVDLLFVPRKWVCEKMNVKTHYEICQSVSHREKDYVIMTERRKKGFSPYLSSQSVRSFVRSLYLSYFISFPTFCFFCLSISHITINSVEHICPLSLYLSLFFLRYFFFSPTLNKLLFLLIRKIKR